MGDKKRLDYQLPAKFVPRFWSGDLDMRSVVYREVTRRYETMKQDAAVESIQQDLLCQRAVFVSLQLETMEIEAATSGNFNPNVYAQLVNCLVGLLKSLGLEKKMPKTLSLKNYVNEKRVRSK